MKFLHISQKTGQLFLHCLIGFLFTVFIPCGIQYFLRFGFQLIQLSIHVYTSCD